MIKKNNLSAIFYLMHVILIIFYFYRNIISVGELGSGLPILATFIALSFFSLILYCINNKIVVAFHFFVFLIFLFWLIFRVAIDLNSFYQLKQITIATTGGIFLFFLIGSFLRNSLDKISMDNKIIQLIIFSILIIVWSIFSSYNLRLERTDIFYISGVDGHYQRPGNFMIILFVISSFSFLAFASNFSKYRKMKYLFHLIIYTLVAGILLISSQMIGSNAATANVLALYMLTFVISILAFSKKIRRSYLDGKLQSFFSKIVWSELIKFSAIPLVVLFIIITIALKTTGFDVTKTRAFGFGTGHNSSLSSRIEILKENAVEQISYSPFFGNVNVAYLTTGNSGRTLHNFLPNLWAELGLIGLAAVLILFYMVIKKLIFHKKYSQLNMIGYQNAIMNIWLIFVFLWIFIYANIATGKSWPVIWFFIGFSVNAIVIKNKKLI